MREGELIRRRADGFTGALLTARSLLDVVQLV
jgi:hypothetical protein